MCRFFEVSRSGYYGFVDRMDKPAKDLELSELIRECQAETKQTYGYRRVAIWLERRGVHHDPKTESSIRIIGMGQELKKVLLAQKDYIEKLKLALGDDFAHPKMVFVSARGNYRDRNSVYQSLKRFTKGTEFEDMTLHQLRHCNATMLLNNGIDLKVVSEHLGHCDVNVTADIYADVLRKTKARTAEQIELCLA